MSGNGNAESARASTADLIGWRMRALGLWRPLPGTAPGDGDGPARVRAVADGLLALQGQDWNAARWALGVRAPGVTEAEVLQAFDSGSLVRSWPMRGTIHVVPAEDLGWMQAATGRRVLAGAAKRREFLGIDDASLSRMTDIALERLSGGIALSREELGAAWIEAGIGDPEKGLGQWRYHVLWWLSQNGLVVAGPVGEAGGEPKLVLAEEWIPSPRRLEGEEALAELAARFARGRGPVGERDLAWWTGLTLREVRTGIAAASDAGRLTAVEIEGVRYWADPELLAESAAAPTDAAALLLPGFDEHLLGYTDRTAVLAAEHFERIVPGRNGMFRSTIVDAGGRVVGVWLRTPRAGGVRIDLEPFPGETVDLDALRARAAEWAVFRGVQAELG